MYIFILKTVSFIARYILRDPFFMVQYGLAYFKKEYIAGVHVLDSKQTIEKINLNKSYIRFGDGEVALMKMIDIHFQKADKQLALELKKIITEYSDSSVYIVAVPTLYINQSNTALKKIHLFRCWLPFKIAFRQYFPKSMQYADAHMFYKKNSFEKVIAPIIKSKYIVICTNKESITSQKQNVEKYLPVEAWIESASTNSYDQIDDMYKKVISEIEKAKQKEFSVYDIVILLSAGPMAKVLAYRISQIGVQCIDVGHGFETLYTSDMRLDKSLI